MSQTLSLSKQLNNDIIQGFEDASTIVPYFMSSIYPLSYIGCNISADGDRCDVRSTTIKNTIASRIFESWQTYILSSKFILVDYTSYLTLFLQYANSKPLYEIWTTSYINYDSNTQTFGNLLFETSQKIVTQTPQAYVDAAKSIESNGS